MNAPSQAVTPLLLGITEQMWPDDDAPFDVWLNDLWRDLVTEYFDERWPRHQHRTTSTLRLGCHGPACLLANRISGRQQRMRNGVGVDITTMTVLQEKIIDELIDHLENQRSLLREQNMRDLIECRFVA